MRRGEADAGDGGGSGGAVIPSVSVGGPVLLRCGVSEKRR